jgi:hypothetical protein
MVRLTITATLSLLALAGCASRNATSARAGRADADRAYATEEQRIMACLDLRDHIVDLYADEYLEEQKVAMSQAERTVFREGWAEELAKRGTFERFESSCYYGVTPRKYKCGMASQSTDTLVACMKISSR